MNNQQRAAMQMALRDLELIWEDNRPSITALREALAQPDHIANAGKVIEQGHSEQAPVAWHEPGSYGNVTTHKDWALANGWEPLYKEKNT